MPKNEHSAGGDRPDTWVIRSGADLGRTIADLRRRRDETQADLAVAAGLPRSRVAKIEAGASTLLIDHVLRLLNRLGATVTVTARPHPDDGAR